MGAETEISKKSIGTYTSFLYIKYNELKIDLTPSPAGEG
jgi:hypothetical protein